MRRTHASGHVAFGFGLASWLLLAAAFISTPGFVGTGSPKEVSSLRGYRVASAAKTSHELDFQPFNSENAESSPIALNWKALVAFVAAMGLSIGTFSTPVYAQAATPTKEERLAKEAAKEQALLDSGVNAEQGDMAGTIGTGKSKKKKIVKVEAKEAAKPAATATAAATPAAEKKESPAPPPPAPVKDNSGSLFYDPDIDDEYLSGRGGVSSIGLGVFLLGPCALFLVFWILGSLNVI